MLLHRVRGWKSQESLADEEHSFQRSMKRMARRLLSRFRNSGVSGSNFTAPACPIFSLSGDTEERLINSDLLRTVSRAQSTPYCPFRLLGDIEELPSSDGSLLPRAFSLLGEAPVQNSFLELELRSIISAPMPDGVAAFIAAAEASATILLQNQLEEVAKMQITAMREASAQESDRTVLSDQSAKVLVEGVYRTPGENCEVREISPSFRDLKVSYESIAYPIMLDNIKTGACTTQTFENIFKFIKAAAPDDRQRLEVEFGHALKSLLVSRVANEAFKTTEPYQEAVCAFARLLHNAAVMDLAVDNEMLEVVDWILQNGTCKAKENALLLILEASACERDKFNLALDFSPQRIVNSVVELIPDAARPSVSEVASKALLSLCVSPENRVSATKAGAVAVLANIMSKKGLNQLTSAMVETCLTVLAFLSTTPEGVRAMREHGAIPLVLIDVMLRVSEDATECAIEILCTLCAPSVDADIDVDRTQERVVQAGARNRLLLVLQCEGTRKSKRRAQELLKMLIRFWLRKPASPTARSTFELLRR